MSLRSLTNVVLIALVSACAGAGHQSIPRPDENSPVPADRCRVYVAREDDVAGTTRHVRVIDGEVEVGAIAEDEYLCWDRRPSRGFGTLYFDGFAPEVREVENVFDLPREAGTTTWFAIEIPHAGRQPQIKPLTPDEGRALIAKRKPAH